MQCGCLQVVCLHNNSHLCIQTSTVLHKLLMLHLQVHYRSTCFRWRRRGGMLVYDIDGSAISIIITNLCAALSVLSPNSVG